MGVIGIDVASRGRGFFALHPAVTFGFFVGAVVLSIVVDQLALQVAGMLCAMLLYMGLNGRKGLKVLAATVPLIVAVALVNPLFSSQGETVFFMLPWGRPYTLQALAYGCSTAVMLASVLLWFLCFNRIMTSDRLMHLFGRFAPALTLVVTMALRFVPSYRDKAVQIAEARACIGRGAGEGSVAKRVSSALPILSSLVTWALEGSIVTADSMRARGYGSGRRTSYASYSLGARDLVVAVALCACLIVALVSVAMGSMAMGYFPALAFPPVTPWGVAGSVAFVVYLVMPACVRIQESISWSISLSKI